MPCRVPCADKHMTDERDIDAQFMEGLVDHLFVVSYCNSFLALKAKIKACDVFVVVVPERRIAFGIHYRGCSWTPTFEKSANNAN